MVNSTSPKHSDAVGYLEDLANDINEPWFTMLRDQVVMKGASVLDDASLNAVCAVFAGRASRFSATPAHPTITTVTPASAVAADSLEQLSAFSNFKLLCDTLQVDFSKPITLVFGANGSGKSSLCESLKVLADSTRPSRPLGNARIPGAGAPSFSYKFRSDAAAQTWTPASGYGLRGETIDYFDASTATENVQAAVEPGRVIALTPFKLHVFELTKALVEQLREVLKEQQRSNAESLGQVLSELRNECSEFSGRPLATVEANTAGVLPAGIALAEAFDQAEELAKKQTSAAALEKATSAEGLRLLKAEHRELDALLTNMRTVASTAARLWALDPVGSAKALEDKQAEQKVLAGVLVPKGQTLDALMTLAMAASHVCALDQASGEVCPLCRRRLEAAQVQLFGQYHELLTGQLEKDVVELKAKVETAGQLAASVDTVKPDVWDENSSLPTELLSRAKAAARSVVAGCSLTVSPSKDVRGVLATLEGLISDGAELLLTKAQAIESSANGRAELLRQLEALRLDIEPLAYAKLLSERVEKLRRANEMADAASSLATSLSAFPPLLAKLTNMAKAAHDELVVSDFEKRLNDEYKNLTEKEMGAFGVALKQIGSDVKVTVLPQIGTNEIDEVLSEGELRVHALALFFAELECSCRPVLVFDDPASSFDYNYIANYCTRLRDFAQTHPTCQIIVLTHNWEFFVQLQTTLNQAGLNGRLSVQVLEDCAVVSDYSEKTDELEAGVTAVLAAPGEPTKQQKEEMAGKLRRLIEAVVNTHVFNGERHQYKQKTQSVSVFQKYTKVTRLTAQEATELGDLYSKLSPTEHDDPRNAFVNTDKATFQVRFDRIKAVEAAVITRR
jgi:recombinational DNA repair ATPase RecF